VAEPTSTGGDRPSAAQQPGVREVLSVAAVVVAIVLAAAALTAVLPRDAQAIVFHTPLLIAVLVLGTAIVLWRILRAPST
jgi:FtsH-binding integral membrane protein